MQFRVLISFIILVVGVACATSPLGRKQFMAVPDSQVNEMGVQAFQEIKGKEPAETDPKINSYVKCVVGALTPQADPTRSPQTWEVLVFKNVQANAFALPGGKIGVYTGILKVAKNGDQLATVIAHEIGHVLAKHGAERVSQEAGTQLGLSAVGAISSSSPYSNTLKGLLGLGAQVGILLPFSRTQESEADLIGLDLMSRAGFDSRQSVVLWKNMMASNQQSTPEWLSTHPASENRITQLEKHMSDAIAKERQAQAAGRNPRCAP